MSKSKNNDNNVFVICGIILFMVFYITNMIKCGLENRRESKQEDPFEEDTF